MFQTFSRVFYIIRKTKNSTAKEGAVLFGKGVENTTPVLLLLILKCLIVSKTSIHTLF